MKVKELMSSIIEGWVKSRRAGAYSVYALSRRIVQAYENNDVDMRRNGEHWLQQQLGKRGITTAFDVGANQGDWVRGLLKSAGDCTVYCFEPVPATFARLSDNVHDTRAKLLKLALSSNEGTLSIKSALDNPDLSSVHDISLYRPGARIEEIIVPASTGDRQMAALGLSHLDILKIDAEGHDFDVLQGFKSALGADQIDFIQFEYNVFTLFAGHLLRQFFDLLEEKYLMCRLLPSGLEAIGYHSVLEDFKQANLVAIRTSIVDDKLIETLGIVVARGLAGSAFGAKLSSMPRLQGKLL